MTAWKTVRAREIHISILKGVLETITLEKKPYEVIEIIPLGITTEQGDYGPVHDTMVLVLVGEPAEVMINSVDIFHVRTESGI